MTRSEAIRRINDARAARGFARNHGGARTGAAELARLERKFAVRAVAREREADAVKARQLVKLPEPAVARPKLVAANDPWSQFLRRRA